VLKLAIPRPDLGAQVRTLADADGRGYVRLLAHDLGRHALLLEHLGPSLERLDRPPEQQLDALVATLQHAWQVPPPPGLLAEPGADKARSLAELVSTLWEQLGRPWPERVVELALTYADRRAGYPLDRSVFVHGDPHPGNALQAVAARPGAESGFCFVDPNGFMADPAYDLGVALRDWGPQLLAGDPLVARAAAERWCQRLAAGSGLDPTRIWEWGFLERVSSGLYVLDLGAVEMSRRFLRTAELLA
jgi:streptomycin 6-kinase